MSTSARSNTYLAHFIEMSRDEVQTEKRGFYILYVWQS